MNNIFDPSPEELQDAEESARLIDDVLAERNTAHINLADVRAAHLLRTIHPEKTVKSAAFTEHVHANSKTLFPRQRSWFYRMRFAIVGIPLVGSMGIAALAFLYATPHDNDSSSVARANQNVTVRANSNTTVNAVESNANNNSTAHTTNTNTATASQNTNRNSNTNVTVPVLTNSTDIALALQGVTADLAALSNLEADITSSIDDINNLIADADSLSSSDTVSSDIDALSSELSTL